MRYLILTIILMGTLPSHIFAQDRADQHQTVNNNDNNRPEAYGHNRPRQVNDPNSKSKYALIKGVVVSQKDNSAILHATVSIEGEQSGCLTDDNGHFTLKAPLGDHKLVVSYLGYKSYQQEINLKKREVIDLNIVLKPSSLDIEKVVVVGESDGGSVNRTAYNVQSLNIGALKNTSANLTQALARMEGVKIRETGGVGSDTQISLNGFTGNHVKIFIDGIPQNGNNGAFSLNNIPASFAERIEVYSGVVPIEFGSDAIGGVINIITDKNQRINSLTLDASYSYGSFNTHKSYFNLGQVLKNGLTYNINAYQNYSDNDYYVDNYIDYYKPFEGGVSVSTSKEKLRVKRFNDAYRNETVIGTIGVTNKSWADILTLKMNYSQYDKDVQTGVTQDVVFGEKRRTGYSFIPTLEYLKTDLFTENLDIRLNANYDYEYTHHLNPTTYEYNWLGDSADRALTPQDSELKSNNWSANFVAKYFLLDMHQFTLSHTVNSTSRISRSMSEGSSVYSDYTTPKLSMKNITGVAYRIKPNEKFDATIFAKYYLQTNEGIASDDDEDLYWLEKRYNSSSGYGTAISYFIIKGLQTKLSYEKAYRLPSSGELFGNGDLELGNFNLRPEKSNNYNFSMNYNTSIDKHGIYVGAGLIYRDTRDYIKRTVSPKTSVAGDSAMSENFGKVETKGYTITARYSYGRLLTIGGTFNNLSARNAEKHLTSGTLQQTLTYGVRIPNQPYIYANGDATLSFYDLFDKEDSFSIMYDLFYQYEFTLNWENIGDISTKSRVPTQLAHSVTFNYALVNGRYNISLESRNLTDAKLYDNYSLQKAGRAFYIKLRMNIFK